MSNKYPKCNINKFDTVKFCGECGTQLPHCEGPKDLMTRTLKAPKEKVITSSASSES